MEEVGKIDFNGEKMFVAIKNDLDGRYKVVESENPKGTAFGDSDCLVEALEGALMLLGEELIRLDCECSKCEKCRWEL